MCRGQWIYWRKDAEDGAARQRQQRFVDAVKETDENVGAENITSSEENALVKE